VSESLFQSVGFFNLFNIIYTILPVEDLRPNHRVSKPGLTKSEARPEPTASPHHGWAGLGFGWAQIDGLRA
jgi:hypothetical protein